MSIHHGETIAAAQKLADEALLRFVLELGDSKSLASLLTEIFGPSAADDVARALTLGQTDWPEIRVVSDASLQGALAAYVAGRDLILISDKALQINDAEPGFLSRLLIEEYGHHLDHQFNGVDTPGDEGSAFYSAVQSEGFIVPDTTHVEDQGFASVDGQQLAVEQATLSDSGGFEGSQTTIALEGSGDNVLKYSFEMYGIPDRFVVRYEGKTLLDTGFVSGSRSGEVKIDRGTADNVQVYVITDDAGTAWNYSLETEGDECPDTAPLSVNAVGGNFEHDPSTPDTCTYTGTVMIGREDGTSQLLRVEGGTVTINKTEVSVSGGTVYAAIGNVSQPLFTGSFKIPYATGKATDLNVGSFLSLGGLEVDLEGFTVGKSGVRFDTEFALPGEIGAIQVNKQTVSSDVLVLDQNGLNFAGPSFKLRLPDAEYKFLNLIEAKASDSTIGYSAFDQQIKFQSKMEIAAPIKGVDTKLTVDILDPNFVSVQNGEVDFKGNIKFERDIELGKFKFKDFSLAIDTTGTPTTVAGTGTFELPVGARTPSIALTLGAALDPLAINTIGFSVDNMNIPAPAIQPGLFFQKLALGVDKLAPGNADPVTYSGGVGFTYGPTINIGKVGPFDFGNFAVSRGDVDVSINQDGFKGTGTVSVFSPSLLKETGTIDLNWAKGTLVVNGGYELLFGAAKGDGILKIDKSYNVGLGGSASVAIPNIDGIPGFLKGKTLQSGNAALTFTNDNNLGNDSSAVWGTYSFFVFGQEVTGVFGLRAEFDGDFSVIGANNIPLAPSASRMALVASADADAAFAVAAAADETDYVLLMLEWSNTDAARPDLVITKPDGSTVQQADFADNNIMIVEELSGDGVVTVAVGPDTAGGTVPTQGWMIAAADETGLGDVTGSRFEIAEPAAAEVTTVASGAGNVSIGYVVTSDASAGDVTLYYDDDGDGYDGVPIASGLQFTPGATATYTWDTSAVPTGDYYVYAVVTSEGGVPTQSPYATDLAVVGSGADLSVVTSLDNVVVDAAAGTVTYEVTLTNEGAATAKGVVFTESYTAGAYYYYDTDAGADYLTSTDNLFSVEVGDIAAGASETINITLYRNGNDAEIVSHSSAASTTSFDDDLLNNTDDGLVSFVEVVPTYADLSVELVTAAGNGAVGDQASYTLRVTNSGPEGADNVILSEYVEGMVSGGYGVANYQISGGSSGQLTATSQAINLGTMASGESKEITISGKIQTAGPTISSSEVRSNTTYDTNFDNNSLVQYRTADAAQVVQADVSLAGTVDKTTFIAGDTLTFTINLTNAGPNSATALQVKFENSAGLEILSGNPGVQGTFDPATGIWDVGNMRDNLTRSLTVTVQVNDADAQFARAQLVAVGEPDPDSAPNNGYTGEDDEIVFFGSSGGNPGGGGGGGGGGGNPGPAILNGDDDNNTFSNVRAPSIVDGKGGFDTVTIDGSLSDYTLQPIEGGFTLVPIDGSSQLIELKNVEQIVFNDTSLIRNDTDIAKTVYALYQAVFDRTPDLGGLTYWANEAAKGVDIQKIVEGFVNSLEFQTLYGSTPSDDALIDAIYQNVFDRAPDEGGRIYWLGELEAGLSDEDLFIGFATSPEMMGIIKNAVDDGLFLMN
ncbi:DUF4214 domain-containing protein [Tianweitania sediminis]|uniref:DUF4214 domain-containing protein n=1 Tax=Tianweitania sediminis TaxID=1502156 RepID=A0A8J7UJI9_9HYPH|nr:DUF4214 domain-containing protein [Tianweitania sediminis]MBP0441379.1 DUF4214 domain-containing protein [Tianweitania sediminis]